ncbi:30S ribosomal protein S20 [Halobacteriovorax marinus]|uniref:Small ribosomal subunit protein bS20 n=1 Tax=Halobacteriovorax marinus (strain ATCC BAA-682 / DSM 15412 / SJ) TaxID=862908 RepID=E1WXZ4_HALMS|nr:30S ribosomal protein S20 [Halobacteriovorax marinus]ATH08847.1 30S ribosomal protein S20 [Halobacteriovorax marinus]CBW27549.1 30S ribosomal protein S20 [Halobacteriovorax marinus SJ]
MANHKSAKKRARQTIVRTARNVQRKSATRNALKAIRSAIESNDKATATGLLAKTQKLLARLAKHGVIKPNAAARKTSRLASQINNL